MPAPQILGEKKPGASILMQPNRIDKVIKEENTCGKVTTILPEGAGLVLYLGSTTQQETRQKVLIFILIAVGLVLTVQFFAFYLASFFTGTRSVNPYLMYPGFDNPRFFGQFQTIMIPIMHGLYFHRIWQEKIFNRGILAAILILQWCIVWALAGRGVMLGIAAAFSILLLTTGPRYRRLLLQALLAMLIGLALYWLFFFCIPSWAGLAQDIPSGLRFGLSKRDTLWLGAWEMIKSNPLLGVGPLHFSAVWNHIGAHPHQAVLQFAAEWGVPATLLLLWIVARAMWQGLMVVRTQPTPLDAGLWAALMASLVLAQVDGVFVMPYTEGWLALIAGLALARWQQPGHTANTLSLWSGYMMKAVLLLAVLVIAKILIVDVPVLHETYREFYEQHRIGSPPRFWDQGWIPM